MRDIETLSKFVKDVQEEIGDPKPMKLTEKDREKYKYATHCWICEQEFEDSDEKVRDHDHFTGKFRGAAHNKCNLDFRVPKFTPVFFHNLKGYDGHFIVKALGAVPGDTKRIANNDEKYISFSKKVKVKDNIGKDKLVPVWHEIRFLDSASFLSDTLANLMGNLTDDDFIETKKFFKKEVEAAPEKRDISL